MTVDPGQPAQPQPADGESLEATASNGGVKQADNSTAPERTRLIVGIGASAGGIDAFKVFFSKMPVDIGMAFVIVQHLDPNYDSSLAAIIAGYTLMPIGGVTIAQRLDTAGEPDMPASAIASGAVELLACVNRLLSPFNDDACKFKENYSDGRDPGFRTKGMPRLLRP